MKHAYLIIAHNEFEVLKRLVSALDDARNDIYVHIDKKVKTMPELHAKLSGLYVLDKRIDVRWGHVSQIKTELLLFETALKNGPYEFYHLISGTHLPLKSQDEIHGFFGERAGFNLFSNLEKRDDDYQVTLKLHRVNLFLRGFASKNRFYRSFSQFMWKSCVAVQRWLHISINNGMPFYWANNWCSMSNDAVALLCEKKREIVRIYRWSFCGDEFFVPSMLMSSPMALSVINEPDLLYNHIGRYNAVMLTEDDYDSLTQCSCLFARKFSAANKGLIYKLLSHSE